MHSKEVVCLARKKQEYGLSIRKIVKDSELSKSTVEYMLETNSERKKEERTENIYWQEDWKENKEDCDTAFDIWRKSYSKKSGGEMWIWCKRPNSTKNAA